MALNKPTRYVLFVLALLLSLHVLLSFTHAPYGNATSLSGLFSPSSSSAHKYTDTAVPAYGGSTSWAGWETVGAGGNSTRANATFVMLARNTDVNGAVQSIRSIEDRFNREHNYPYVFLNEEPFTDEFKKCVLRRLRLIDRSVLLSAVAWALPCGAMVLPPLAGAVLALSSTAAMTLSSTLSAAFLIPALSALLRRDCSRPQILC
ncbi:Glycosyltransferase family 15 protein [Mycena sanguinolenta]|uniref:Glycosyltransferase family 15 protein n=1 Tax=Mycena sanguinolenta TaxID=230812 RepID=A0A8H6YIN8_9AGAR|nr:Glycosyltransferase family 15 protein [Mycena sanguinolenta]